MAPCRYILKERMGYWFCEIMDLSDVSASVTLHPVVAKKGFILFRCDRQFNLLSVNQAWVAYTGFDVAQSLGSNLFEYMRFEGSGDAQDIFEHLQEAEISVVTFVNKSGEHLPMTLQIYQDDSYISGSLRPVGGEVAPQMIYDLYRSVFDVVSTAFVIINQDARVLQQNPAARKLFGDHPLPPCFSQALMRWLVNPVVEKKTIEWGGRQFWLEFCVVDHHRGLYLFGIQDVSDELAAGRGWESKAMKYRVILDHCPYAIVLVGDGNPLWCNRLAALWFDLTQGDLTRQSGTTCRPDILQMLRDCMTADIHKIPDGKIYQSRVCRAGDEHIVILEDITERHAKEESLAAFRDHLQSLVDTQMLELKAQRDLLSTLGDALRQYRHQPNETLLLQWISKLESEQ